MEANIVEDLSAAVHSGWMETKKSQGITTRKSEWGEELMVEYALLSEKAKDLDRGTVKAVLGALPAAGYGLHLLSSGFGMLMEQHKRLQADFEALKAEAGRLALQIGGARMGMPTTTAPEPTTLPTYPGVEGVPFLGSLLIKP